MALHRAFCCFFALQSLALRPVVQFVAQRRAELPPLSPDEEKQYKNLEKASLRIQLIFIRDHWETHFSNGVARTLRGDVQIVLHTQGAAFYSGSPQLTSIWKGIQAIRRLLDVVGPCDEVKAQARELQEQIIAGGEERGDENAHVKALPTCQDEMDAIEATLVKKPKAWVRALRKRSIELMKTEDDTVEELQMAVFLLCQALSKACSKAHRFTLLLMRCDCYYRLKDTKEAVVDAHSAMRLKTEMGKTASKQLADVFSGAGRWDLAAEAYAKGLRMTPDDAELEARCSHATIRQYGTCPNVITNAFETTESDSSEPDTSLKVSKRELFEQANDLSSHEDASVEKLQEATRLLTRLVGQATCDKQLARVLALRSKCFLKLGQLERANADAMEASNCPQLPVSAAVHVVRAFRALEKWRDANEVLQVALRRSPRNEELLMNQKIVRLGLASWDEAEETDWEATHQTAAGEDVPTTRDGSQLSNGKGMNGDPGNPI